MSQPVVPAPHAAGPVDDVGAETLRRMAGLEAYNRWLHDRFEAYLGQRVLEIGSGIGNQTRYFADRERVVASDIDPFYLQTLQQRFGDRAERAPGVVSVSADGCGLSGSAGRAH